MTTKYAMNIADFSIESLLNIVSDLLVAMLNTNDKIATTKLTYFHSRTVPNISIHSYLLRIHKFAPFGCEALLSMLIYFDRISKLSDFTINSFNIHRLLITSIVISSKFTSDVFYANSRYAKVGGIPLRELNQLELEFLFMSDFQLYITLEELQEYADQLLTHAMSLPNSIETHTTSITSTTSPTYNEPRPPPVKTVALPLTPPYKPSKPRRTHPYQRPCNKKRLGLVSPKD